MTLAVFGQLALEPHFGDAFRSLFPSPTLEDYQHLFSAVIHKNPSMEADLQKVQFFTRSEPDSQRPSLEPLRKEIERHFKPEFFAEGHELSTFDFSQTAISFDGERGEELHRQSVGAALSDPIRFWTIRAYGELWDHLGRPPSGAELRERYPKVVTAFPVAEIPYSPQVDTYAPGLENIRKTLGELDLWVLDDKLLQSVKIASIQLRSSGKKTCGESLWNGLTTPRRQREDISGWSIKELWDRFEQLAFMYFEMSRPMTPLLSIWLQWKSMTGPPLVALQYHISCLERHGSEPASTTDLSDQDPSDLYRSVAWMNTSEKDRVVESLQATLRFLEQPHLSDDSVLVSDLYSGNSLYREMVTDLNLAMIEKIAATPSQVMSDP